VEKLHVWALLPTLFILIAALIEFFLGDFLTEKRFPSRTERMLNTYQQKVFNLHNTLLENLQSVISSLRSCDLQQVNATLHLLVNVYSSHDHEQKPAFFQITSYTGQLSGGQWRFNDVSKGVIGRCYRTRKVEHVNFSNENEYESRMVCEFGYNVEEMKSHAMSARSYLAHPLFNNSEFIGVLYLFTAEAQVFPKAANLEHINTISGHISELLRSSNIV
jgi:hypothetical protein